MPQTMTYQPQAIAHVQINGNFVQQGLTTGRWQNNWHFAADLEENPAWTPTEQHAQMLGLANLVHQVYKVGIMDLISWHLGIQFTQARIIEPFESVTTPFVELVQGSIEEAYDEPDDAIVISKRTLVAGRSGLGRVYIPGIPDTAATEGMLTTQFSDDMAAALSPFVEDAFTVTGVPWVPGVWSPTRAGPGGVMSAGFSPLFSLQLDRIVRKMTSREIQGREVIAVPDA